MSFSIVVPVRNEVDLIPKALPSYCAVSPGELIVCVDKPAPEDVVNVVGKVAKACGFEGNTRIVEVERRKDYAFHQAWVRRKGFLESRYDKILTTDIDVVINRNVLKAINLVGKNNVGLVSCSKNYPLKGFQKIWRSITREIVRMIYPIRFTGLYALWRPYWLDTEDEGIRSMQGTSQGSFGIIRTGEDTYLRDHMIKRHKIICLRDIGGKVLTFNNADLPRVQFESGRYFAANGYGLARILSKVFLYFQIHVLRGWLYERRMRSR